MKVAVVGATGLVGGVMLEVLKEQGFPYTELLLVASERSVGKEIAFDGKTYHVIDMPEAIRAQPDVAIFSAGGSTSLEWAPRFAAAGITVIDNSSAWRMDPDKKLIVPEINAHLLSANDKIIANPNCSTIQMVMALAPLHKAFTIERLVISTYQSVTGTGMKAVKQYNMEKNGYEAPAEEMAYRYRIFENVIPHCDAFLENGYTKEEMKLVNETRKILGDDSIRITATAVRVPVLGGHSESVNATFAKPFHIPEIYELLRNTPGVVLLDDPAQFQYPMPLFAKNQDEVFVGRIRRDESAENTLNLWIVADNLRKGAATNAVQIAAYLAAQKLIGASITA
ncbi:MAG TPA: aspartate-semialdehyde dehydrogenase [Saprospiraceae bacterium]|nr:aspartate-semialdehyde dehydrogenase [Saprospiraceae bacterium]HMP13160.1 aspartate-semialdehyde dehydrogenase [Saprospiraceae bacterium]